MKLTRAPDTCYGMGDDIVRPARKVNWQKLKIKNFNDNRSVRGLVGLALLKLP